MRIILYNNVLIIIHLHKASGDYFLVHISCPRVNVKKCTQIGKTMLNMSACFAENEGGGGGKVYDV